MFTRKFKYVVYQLTFSNGEIYVGKDIGFGGHSIRYFGSWNREVVEQEFSKKADFTLRKLIHFVNESKEEVSRVKNELILSLGANYLEIGYNNTPKLRKTLNRDRGH